MYTFCQTKCLPEYVYENDIKIWNIKFFHNQIIENLW